MNHIRYQRQDIVMSAKQIRKHSILESWAHF